MAEEWELEDLLREWEKTMGLHPLPEDPHLILLPFRRDQERPDWKREGF